MSVVLSSVEDEALCSLELLLAVERLIAQSPKREGEGDAFVFVLCLRLFLIRSAPVKPNIPVFPGGRNGCGKNGKRMRVFTQKTTSTIVEEGRRSLRDGISSCFLVSLILSISAQDAKRTIQN
jgi:hypothetical protein